jgi:hypothetical protein
MRNRLIIVLLFKQKERDFLLKGAPFVCTICNGVGHLKSECPDLIVPNMIDLPEINKQWIDILSRLCHQITGKIYFMFYFGYKLNHQ